MNYYKSPFNYIGNKYRIINQIQKWFPKKINTMLDLFCGGCDVIINTNAKHKYANDINFFLINILKEFQGKGQDKNLTGVYALPSLPYPCLSFVPAHFYPLPFLSIPRARTGFRYDARPYTGARHTPSLIPSVFLAPSFLTPLHLVYIHVS